jgi:hypothetical protein
MLRDKDVTRLAKAGKGAVVTFTQKRPVGFIKLQIFAALVLWRVKRRVIIMRRPDDRAELLVLVEPPLWVYVTPGGLMRFLELSGMFPTPVAPAIARRRPRRRSRSR